MRAAILLGHLTFLFGVIVYGLLRMKRPETLGKVEFDPEAEGLAIWSKDREALEFVSRLVAEAKRDPTLLEQAIRTATADGKME